MPCIKDCLEQEGKNTDFPCEECEAYEECVKAWQEFYEMKEIIENTTVEDIKKIYDEVKKIDDFL